MNKDYYIIYDNLADEILSSIEDHHSPEWEGCYDEDIHPYEGPDTQSKIIEKLKTENNQLRKELERYDSWTCS